MARVTRLSDELYVRTSASAVSASSWMSRVRCCRGREDARASEVPFRRQREALEPTLLLQQHPQSHIMTPFRVSGLNSILQAKSLELMSTLPQHLHEGPGL